MIITSPNLARSSMTLYAQAFCHMPIAHHGESLLLKLQYVCVALTKGRTSGSITWPSVTSNTTHQNASETEKSEEHENEPEMD